MYLCVDDTTGKVHLQYCEIIWKLIRNVSSFDSIEMSCFLF